MLNYIANEQEKNEINNILAENEKKYEEELREKYNPDNLFKKKENKQEEKVEEQHSLMVVENKPWYNHIYFNLFYNNIENFIFYINFFNNRFSIKLSF